MGTALAKTVYSCTRLAGTEKKGVLKVDADGYYEIVIGAFDAFNAGGAWYDYNLAKHLFNESESLMRRITAGQLRCEYAHPKREHWMSDKQWLDRVYTVEEKNVCCHIKSIELQGTNPVLVVAKLKPTGPYADALQRALDNPSENVSFSIRCISDDGFIGTKYVKAVRQIITWDYVNEPGISHAEKYKTASLESFNETIITRDNVIDLMEYRKERGISMESSDALIHELMSGFNSVKGPAFMKW